ncbi:MAG: DUF4942 domain-containing protein, partial [Candidatus Omnitrophica bacterium]|nr:DUF4942 domain-containing protein [Candidatus Omnitrophota bacterium]
SSLGGLIFIFITALLSLFAYALIGDQSPNANNQKAEIALKNPGFSSLGILLKNKRYESDKGQFSKLIYGAEKPYDWYPIKEAKFVPEGIEVTSHYDKQKIISLVELYQDELQTMLENYKALNTLKPELLKELGVNVETVRGGLKEKITGLKNIYWKLLFDNFDKITQRLTNNSRRDIFNTLTGYTNIDFTESNCYSVTVWAIQNANKYYDKQLLKLYDEFSNKKSIRGYKSNEKVWKDDIARYQEKVKNHEKYKLDYRIVYAGCGSCLDTDWRENETGKLTDSAQTFLDDVCTIAHNLGFLSVNDTRCHDWYSGEKVELSYMDCEYNRHDFAEVRPYKNGNI